ncbi:MAG TPA: hypothetical protein VFH56_15905, partial [Acidimicrobiales bacterium]|nr:hypothetical protein [Acidimicrobiales bacterium]
FVADISDDFDGGSITHDGFAEVAGDCSLKITRELVWGKDRVRPWMTVSDGVNTVRFDQGVFVMTTPDEKRGEDPITYDVTGYDLCHLLQDDIGNTYVVAAGTTYLQAVRDVLTASGVGSTALLAGDMGATALPYTMVWGLSDAGPTWLQVINDLLSVINYEPLWADEQGVFRSGPYADPATQPVGWTLDTSDDATNIVAPDRTLSADQYAAPNWWRFIRTNMSTTPTEGDGIYTPATNATDPAQTLVGRIVRKVVHLDAADQATLQAQGDKVVQQDQAITRVWRGSIDPLPVLGHRDVIQVNDAGRADKLVCASWTLNLDGSPGAITLGGGKDPEPQPFSGSATATVTQASPLRIQIDGATVDSIANSLDGAAYAVGDRVTCTLRDPVPPLVQGKQTT